MKQGKKNLIALWETLNIYKSGYTKSFSQNSSRNQEAYYLPFSKIIILESKSLMQNFGWKTHKWFWVDICFRIILNLIKIPKSCLKVISKPAKIFSGIYPTYLNQFLCKGNHNKKCFKSHLILDVNPIFSHGH